MSIIIYDGDDAAADWQPEWSDYHDIPLRAGLPKMSIPAHNAWREAWQRGLVSDVEMAWYTMLIRLHPYSWMGWLRG